MRLLPPPITTDLRILDNFLSQRTHLTAGLKGYCKLDESRMNQGCTRCSTASGGLHQLVLDYWTLGLWTVSWPIFCLLFLGFFSPLANLSKQYDPRSSSSALEFPPSGLAPAPTAHAVQPYSFSGARCSQTCHSISGPVIPYVDGLQHVRLIS